MRVKREWYLQESLSCDRSRVYVVRILSRPHVTKQTSDTWSEKWCHLVVYLRNYLIYEYLKHHIVYNRSGLAGGIQSLSFVTSPPSLEFGRRRQVQAWQMAWKIRSKTRLVSTFLSLVGVQCVCRVFHQPSSPAFPVSLFFHNWGGTDYCQMEFARDENHNILVFVSWVARAVALWFVNQNISHDFSLVHATPVEF